jgi:hypothetical protein
MSLLVRRTSGNLIDTLIVLRKRVLRKGLWFQSLTLEDRILADLIQRHVKIVKNTTLATVIARIMGKLMLALRNSFLDKLVLIGRPIAEAVAMKAYSYGNKEALGWMHDLNYIKYMGLTHSPPIRDHLARSGRAGMLMQEKRGI